VVDEYLADQLLLPLALGKGGEFSAQYISEHTRTQAAMIQHFLDCDIFLPATDSELLDAALSDDSSWIKVSVSD
jgi:RNA 3'-terminal phosphate cyclase (ATP)